MLIHCMKFGEDGIIKDNSLNVPHFYLHRTHYESQIVLMYYKHYLTKKYVTKNFIPHITKVS